MDKPIAIREIIFNTLEKEYQVTIRKRIGGEADDAVSGPPASRTENAIVCLLVANDSIYSLVVKDVEVAIRDIASRNGQRHCFFTDDPRFFDKIKEVIR